MNSSAEQTESATFLISETVRSVLSDDAYAGTFICQQWNFIVRSADWTKDVFSLVKSNRSHFWVANLNSVLLLFIAFSMSKFQYLLKNVKYATRLLYFPYTHKPLGECVYEENTMDKWHVSWYPTRKHCITTLFHA